MNRIKIVVFGLLACVCVLYASFVAYGVLDSFQENKGIENIEKTSAKTAKNVVDKIYVEIKEEDKNKQLNKLQLYELVKNKINEINLKNYETKVYALDNLGFYISHYSKDYEGANAFLEKDMHNRKYMKDLINQNPEEGCYARSKILWTNNSIRHFITYIKKDKTYNIYYGCTIDLDNALLKKHSHNKEEYKKAKIYIIISSILGIILIIVIMFYKIRRFK